MEKLTLLEYLEPFTDLSSYLRALKIISANYSVLDANYPNLTNSINTLVDKKLSKKDIKDFIQRVRTMPDFYGLTGVANDKVFENNLHSYNVDVKAPTLVIEPKLDMCIFCKNVKLITKPIRFSKNPLVYSRIRIGKNIDLAFLKTL